jgi:hypothetical protein
VVAALFGAEPEVQVKCNCVLDHVATFAVPGWFFDCVGGVESRDKLIQEVPHNCIAILHFCFYASYHSLDAVVCLSKAHRHHSAQGAGHVLVAFEAKARDAEAFLSTAELDSVEWDEADAERLASTGEAFVPIDDGGRVKFVKEETCGECGRHENRLLLWAKAVVLAVVPVLADGAMEADEFVVNVRVSEANIDEVIVSQGKVLMQAIGAAVVLVGCLTADGLGWGFVAIGAGAGGAGSVIIGARWVEGATVVSTCPPIMRSVVIGACSGARCKVSWVWVNGRCPCAWGLGAHVDGRGPLTWGLQACADRRCVWVGGSRPEREIG